MRDFGGFGRRTPNEAASPATLAPMSCRSREKGVLLVFAPERHAHILQHLQRHRRATVSELANLLQTSESTVRRDLQELERARRLKRTHGGAVLQEHAAYEPTWQEKGGERTEAKARIGAAAASLVEDGDTVLLDAGSTTVHVARALQSRTLTVVTNSLVIADELAGDASKQLLLLGGELRPNTGAMVGPFTEQMLSQMHVDILFLGVNGMHDGGVTTPNVMEGATKRAMVRAAKHVVVVSDVSKVGQVSLVQVCTWDAVDTLVVDEGLDDPALNQALAGHGVRVVVARG
ncbi:MAG: DeoR/GlpR family DNA-binding transcription regulator [Alicyclobacillus sp.]|nr:DeoR/GlpR family DNA-binding transcription regulator [Alicyclobacillus sp.]